MAHKSKIPAVILNQGNKIPEGAIIITASKKKKKRTPELVAKTRKKLNGGGIASGMRRFNRGG